MTLIETSIYIAIILLIIAAILKVQEVNKKKSSNGNKHNTVSTNETYLPYRKKHLLTKTEYQFYNILKPKCDNKNVLICPKVRLEDLAEVTVQKNHMKYRGYIKSRHVDFILCNSNLNVIAAIELDDSSHNQKSAQQVDFFKDNFFKTIGIPLFRIKTVDDYNSRIDHLLYYLIPNMHNVPIASASQIVLSQPVQPNMTDLLQKQNELLETQNSLLAGLTSQNMTSDS